MRYKRLGIDSVNALISGKIKAEINIKSILNHFLNQSINHYGLMDWQIEKQKVGNYIDIILSSSLWPLMEKSMTFSEKVSYLSWKSLWPFVIEAYIFKYYEALTYYVCANLLSSKIINGKVYDLWWKRIVPIVEKSMTFRPKVYKNTAVGITAVFVVI